jgi:hypothetical protein
MFKLSNGLEVLSFSVKMKDYPTLHLHKIIGTALFLLSYVSQSQLDLQT